MKPRNKELFSIAVTLDTENNIPYYVQVYEELRSAILTGRLPASMKLPSTRTLSDHLDVSRNTIVTAFEQLLAEGYLEGKTGSGTFVACRLPEDLLKVRVKERVRSVNKPRIPRLSRRGQVMRATPIGGSVPPGPLRPKSVAAFRPNMPALDAFPVETWLKIAARHWRMATTGVHGFGEAAGYWPLREQIAAYMKAARAVRCEPEQVILMSGSQQGLDIIARVLLDPGDTVWVEEPGYIGARAAFLANGANLVPVPVDEEGFNLQVAIKKAPDTRLAYVTPSHQFPMGMTMSLCRRLDLLDWANRSNGWVIEDDYDSEYRYEGRPLASLQGLDTQNRVIYLGTFSKVLMPSIRLGYLIVPLDLVEPFVAAKSLVDWHSPLIDHAIIADFMAEGHYVRHIRRMRKLYQQRQAYLVDAAAKDLKGILEVAPHEAGMNLIGWLPEGADDLAAWAAGRKLDVITRALSRCAVEPIPRGGLIMGYTALDRPAIRAGVKKLATALRTADLYPAAVE
jgi:GntR family transcriptional regulator/MocR family aminotransferase